VSPTVSAGTHAAGVSEPPLTHVLGYDYTDLTPAQQDSFRMDHIVADANNRTPGLVLSVSGHNVLPIGSPDPVATQFEWKLGPKFAHDSTLQTQLPTAMAATWGGKDNAGVRTQEIGSVQVAISWMLDKNGFKIYEYVWISDGIFNMLVGGPDNFPMETYLAAYMAASAT
jgi:hypothetical protein